MSLFDRARQRVATWIAPPATDTQQQEERPTAIRPRRKTRRSPRTSFIPVAKTRWLQSDIEAAAKKAQSGDLTVIGQLYRAMSRDGAIQGLLGTRTGGLVRLPKQFRGTDEAKRVLGSKAGDSSLFDKIFPQSELEQLDADGIVCGIGIAEFVQEEGKEYPVLTRLDPEFLLYRSDEDCWYYRSREGMLRITPGDGRWVLYTPKGRYEPWNRGNWQALGRAFVAKEHAFLHRENYAATLANPARIAVAPQGSSESQRIGWFQQVLRWGASTVFGMTPGYDVKLLESNGRGFEVFQQIIATSDKECMVAIAGQEVTTTGGVGFANASVFDAIRTDLVQGDGNALAACLNEQAIPHVVADYVGDGHSATVAWDTTPPPDRKAEAEATKGVAEAIKSANEALKPYGLRVDAKELATRNGIPVEALEATLDPQDPPPSNENNEAAKAA